MKFQNLSVKRLFGRVAMELVLSMSGITIALFLVTKQIAVLLTRSLIHILRKDWNFHAFILPEWKTDCFQAI